MGITTSSDGKDPDYMCDTPRVNMGNTPSLSAAHIPVDNPLMLLWVLTPHASMWGILKRPHGDGNNHGNPQKASQYQSVQ